MSYRIDLILFVNPIINFRWKHGQVHYLSTEKENHKSLFVDELKNIDSDYLLFWDFNNDLPSYELLIKLCNKNYDLIHGSYWEDKSMEPRYLNYVKPIWLYNLQAKVDLEFSSFRCTPKNVLVKTQVFKSNFDATNKYVSLDFNFLDFGDRLLNNGGIVRYNPELN